MAISINPVLPVLAAKEAGGIASELVLAPGSVVNAQVLKVLDANLVRIAIAALSIDVLTEIPLQEGQSLQLAVSQTKDGIRLALVGQGGAWAGEGSGIPTIVSPITARNSSRERFATSRAGNEPADGAVAGTDSTAASGATRAKARTRKSSFFIGTSFQTQRSGQGTFPPPTGETKVPERP